MLIGNRIKKLRKEKGWNQSELAKMTGSDARQISRYENGRVTPSLEAIVKIATAFDVTIDYLLIEDASRRPLKTPDNEFLDRLHLINALSDKDKSSLAHIIDALLAKNKFKSLADNIG